MLAFGSRANADDDDDRNGKGSKCPPGLAKCGGFCRDVAIDPDNCGSCGTVCANGAVCRKGVCVAQCPPPTCLPPCPPGLTLCNGNCVVTSIDPSNCGSCNSACQNGQTCVAGRCANACPPGSILCNGACVAVATDPNNCGSCGVRCPSGACLNGQCVASSDAACAGKAIGAPCSFPNGSGTCTLSGTTVTCIGVCNAGYVNCNNSSADGCETNITTDPQNCGACNHLCATEETCVNGVCTTTCPPGQTLCAGVCSNTTTDPHNCGACGTVCQFPNATAVCINGTCAIGACSPGFADCDGQIADGCETNISSDVQNCGACGNHCVLPNATATCVNGTCAVASCNAGFANCDGQVVTGCEVNTRSDRLNCGACGNVCQLPNATATCINGTCQIASCNAGFANCDGNPATGCETNTQISRFNCGGCGVTCQFANANSICVNGACQIASCNPGFANCNGQVADGCEINILTDRLNCGACGNVCASGQACLNGVCV